MWRCAKVKPRLSRARSFLRKTQASRNLRDCDAVGSSRSPLAGRPAGWLAGWMDAPSRIDADKQAAPRCRATRRPDCRLLIGRGAREIRRAPDGVDRRGAKVQEGRRAAGRNGEERRVGTGTKGAGGATPHAAPERTQ